MAAVRYLGFFLNIMFGYVFTLANMFYAPEGRCVENRSTYYLSEKSSDFDEIWYIAADIELDGSHVTKYGNFKNKFTMADSSDNESCFVAN